MSNKRSSSKRTRLFLVSLVVFILLIGTHQFIGKNNLPCANSISCIKDLSGVYETTTTENIFMGRRVTPPKFVADDISLRRVLGQTTEPKHIYVDLTNQRLQAFEGNRLVMQFPISSGKWAPTPTGDFKIWIKLRYTRMSGGNPADGTYYNLANVPYVMFFSGSTASAERGFSLHGAYWHNNFGYPMSHGCVNIRPEDAKKLYYWADPASQENVTRATAENPGTPVTIFGAPPV